MASFKSKENDTFRHSQHSIKTTKKTIYIVNRRKITPFELIASIS